jgi:hypothetical protein
MRVSVVSEAYLEESEEMGRINVELSDELEKKLRFKTIEKFGGKKGDLSRAIEEAVRCWVAPEQNA